MGKNKHSKKGKTADSSGQPIAKKKKVIALISFLFIIGIAAILFNQQNNGGLFSFVNREAFNKQKAKEYDESAGKILEALKVEMAKPVSPYKFMLGSISETESLLWEGLDLDSTLTTAWEKLGYVNSQFHGKQALLRYDSYKNQGKEEKMLEEEKNTIVYYAKADVYYNKAIEFGHLHPDWIYYQKAAAESSRYNYEKAAIYLLEAIEINPNERMYQAKLIDAFLYAGKFGRALARIERYRKDYPESELPYRNLGSLFMFQGDTSAAVLNYMEAIEKGTKPEVGKLLHKYFSEQGDEERADYYLQKSREAETQWDPNKY